MSSPSATVTKFPFSQCWQLRKEIGDEPDFLETMTLNLETSLEPGQVMRPVFNPDGYFIDVQPVLLEREPSTLLMSELLEESQYSCSECPIVINSKLVCSYKGLRGHSFDFDADARADARVTKRLRALVAPEPGQDLLIAVVHSVYTTDGVIYPTGGAVMHPSAALIDVALIRVKPDGSMLPEPKADMPQPIYPINIGNYRICETAKDPIGRTLQLKSWSPWIHLGVPCVLFAKEPTAYMVPAINVSEGNIYVVIRTGPDTYLTVDIEEYLNGEAVCMY